VDVATMHQTLPARHAEEGGWQAVELLYRDRNMAMDILLPAKGELNAIDQALDAARLTSLLGQLKEQSVALALPKFTYESSFNLNDTLSAMGMLDPCARATSPAWTASATCSSASSCIRRWYEPTKRALRPPPPPPSACG
jgi:serine protease inhibitor